MRTERMGMDIHIMRHVTRRIFLAVGIGGLILLGLLHPGNEWALPGATFAAFMVLFAIGAAGGSFVLAQGRQAFHHAGRFLLTSEALIILAGIIHLALFGLALVSWADMMLYERILVPLFAGIGIYGGFREFFYGILPDDQQRRRDAASHSWF